MKNLHLSIILSIVAVILLIPLVAMQFSLGFDWNTFDFIIAGILLTGTGLIVEFVLRKIKKMEYRIVLCLAIFAILFLVWAELAVGIFGSPIAGS
ncbi:MAG: hypothetical protein IPI31_09705 [Bacteroidetes bacterium]|jgi:Kef-type K+ transport system membrane component KefB|nr:hypothetical protein [Bacteroidota bacterium]MBK7568084.1 hypothetical protein [Bacteroidota bacterium]